MRITSLAENTSISEKIGYEHGLSLFIETEKHNILFDMGRQSCFRKMQKSLESTLERQILPCFHTDIMTTAAG